MSVGDLAVYITQSVIHIVGHLLIKQMVILRIRLCLQFAYDLFRKFLSLAIFAGRELTLGAVPQVIVKRQNIRRRKPAISITTKILLRSMLGHISRPSPRRR